jgi:glutamate synthase domain-containing protein 3
MTGRAQAALAGRPAGEVAEFDLAVGGVRLLNAALHKLPARSGGLSPSSLSWRVLNPRGLHAIAAGADAALTIEICGNVGYYCAGMNKHAAVIVRGNAGVGVAENIMSGFVHIMGDASHSAGATGCGGTLIIDGNAAARCGISMKGVDIVVKGSIGHMSAFMGQAGTLTVLGDAGEGLGDSIYEARLYVRGAVKSLGADCIEKSMSDVHKAQLYEKLKAAGIAGEVDVSEFRRYGSARQLYHFHVDNALTY